MQKLCDDSHVCTFSKAIPHLTILSLLYIYAIIIPIIISTG